MNISDTLFPTERHGRAEASQVTIPKFSSKQIPLYFTANYVYAYCYKQVYVTTFNYIVTFFTLEFQNVSQNYRH